MKRLVMAALENEILLLLAKEPARLVVLMDFWKWVQ